MRQAKWRKTGGIVALAAALGSMTGTSMAEEGRHASERYGSEIQLERGSARQAQEQGRQQGDWRGAAGRAGDEYGARSPQQRFDFPHAGEVGSADRYRANEGMQDTLRTLTPDVHGEPRTYGGG